MKNPVTKLIKATIELSNGVSFIIVHNMDDRTFDAAFDNWLARTDDFTADSFVVYVKSKREPGRIFLNHADYENITDGKVESATEEDYQAENN